MNNMAEIKQRLDRMAQLGKKMREQLTGLSGPDRERLKKNVKKEGTRVGIGAGVSFFGLAVAAVASVYILAVIILLVNIALDRLWLSALIVVGGSILIGGAIIAIGVGMARRAAKELSKTTGDATTEIKKIGEEIKTEVEELQKAARKEAEERKPQIVEMVGKAKKAAPVVVGAVLLLLIIRRARKSRKQTRAVLRVIELYEEARTQGERS